MKKLTRRKAALQARLLDHSSAVAKRRGLSALTIDSMMRGVNRTGSVFYSLFRSKSSLFEAMEEREVALSMERFSRYAADRKTRRYEEWADCVLHEYLSLEHVRDHEGGCALPALGTDVTRLGNGARVNYERALENIVAATRRGLGCSESVAWALGVQCIGTVMVARAVASEERREKLLTASADFIRSAVYGRAARRPKFE
ncbi:TetR/AcrR family transcriptional regulator [Herbaspirillum sp. HC18]|nr:TetR/AcrR family transcriptional regulator [Herbaspirillum sp. HC18]